MLLAHHEVHLWITHQPAKTRAFIRDVLSHYLECPPHRIHFTSTLLGKPQLKDRRIALQFNASHTHGLLVCAVSRGIALGVDAEFLPRKNNPEAIAARYFHPEEVKQLQALRSPEERRQHFFRLWTLKEATIKALGKTIGSCSLDSLPFLLDEHNELQPAFSWPSTQQWQFHHLALGDYLIAVAQAERSWHTRPATLRVFRPN